MHEQEFQKSYGPRLTTLGVVAALLLAATQAEAKRFPLPAPDPERGTIAVTMRARSPVGSRSAVNQVYFVRLGEDVDPFAAESLIRSDFSKDKQVYLLNARAGRYVAVAGELAVRGSGEYHLFLDKAAIAQTEIEVLAGEISFMGDLLVDLKMKMSRSDAAQAHYLRLIQPSAARRGFMSRSFSRQYVYRGTLVSADHEPATRAEFWSRAREKVFAEEPAWRARFDERPKEEPQGLETASSDPSAPADESGSSSLYGDYPDQFSLTLPDDWTAYDQSRLTGGELGHLNVIVFSPVDLSQLMKPTRDEEATKRMVEVMADLDTGRIECFTLNRHAASKGMTCEGFSDKATKRVLEMVKKSSFLSRGAQVEQEPRAERADVGGCEGLRILGSGRAPGGPQWSVDARAVSDGEILFLFAVRAMTEHLPRNRETFELALSSLRMAAAS